MNPLYAYSKNYIDYGMVNGIFHSQVTPGEFWEEVLRQMAINIYISPGYLQTTGQ